MTIFKSHQVNLDPMPAADYRGTRYVAEAYPKYAPLWDPRPEFAPTRDKRPWKLTSGWREFPTLEAGTRRGYLPVWMPDREQFDTPVNPILVAFRAGTLDVDWFLYEYNHDTDSWVWDRTPEQIDHARRVLTRLANFA